ncbi:MAG: alpha/beta fold hydrolase, partial [Myxococcota bacterium]
VTSTGTFGVLPTGMPYSDTVAVDYMLTTPNGGTACAAFGAAADPSWDYSRVAVFVHGLGRCKNDMLALADTLATASYGGWSVLALDGPRAGARVIEGLGDQDLDGCADQPETPELIALTGESPNPFAVRDQVREWGLEVAQVANLVKAEPWLFVGAADPGTEVVTRVGVVGHSWGGMAATLAGPVMASSVDAMVLSAAPSDLGAIFSPLLQAAVPAADFPATLAAFVWAMEPADPLFAVPSYPAEATSLPVLAQVIDGGSAALNGSLTASLHGVDAQTALADAFEAGGRTATTTVMDWDNGTATVPICSDPTGVVGAMLKWCVEDTDPAFGAANDKLAAMRGDLVYFLNAGVLP